MSLQQPMTQQETFDEIAKLVETRGDSFNIKIMRRNGPHDAMPEMWALFYNATARQIAEKETWLTPLTGDGCGLFECIVFHSSEHLKPVGSPLRMNKDGNVRSGPVVELIAKPEWTGPRSLQHPKIPPKASVVEMTSAPVTQITAQTPIAAQPGVMRKEAELSGSISEKRLLDALSLLEKREQDLREREKKMEMEQMLAPIRERSAMLERAIADADRRHAEVLAELKAKSNAPIPATEDAIDKVTKIASALGLSSLIQNLMEKSSTNQRELIKSIQDSADKNMAAVTTAIEKLAGKNDGMHEATMKMGEVMGAAANVVVQMTHEMRNLQGPPSEQSALVEFAEALSRPLDKIASAYLLKAQKDAGSDKLTQPTQKQLPSAQTETQPAKQADEVSPDQIPNLLNMGQMIMNYEPQKKVVDYFFANVSAPDVQAALADVDPAGDPEAMVDKFMEEWIAAEQKNMEYVRILKLAFRDGAKARGMLKDDASSPAQTPPSNNGANGVPAASTAGQPQSQPSVQTPAAKA